MKEHKKVIGLAATVLLAFSPGAWAVQAISNTGAGAEGTVDGNYLLVTDATGATLLGGTTQSLIQFETGSLNGTLIGPGLPWNPNDTTTGAKWISPWITGDSTDPYVSDLSDHTYFFRTVAISTGLVSGLWQSDNDAQIYVNGVHQVGMDSAGIISGMTAFSLNLNAGDKVVFAVHNGVTQQNIFNPSGLFVDVLSTPDGGSTLMLLGGALSAMGLLRRKLIA